MVSSIKSIPWLYHFTDSRNLPSIKESGGLYSTAALHKRGIDDFRPSGNDQSLTSDRRFGMDKYVHLCFIGEHPLEYLARKDGRIEKPVWLKIDPSIMDGEDVLFCPGVANKANMPTVPIMDAAHLIDFEVLYNYKGMDWKDQDIKKRRLIAKKCEVLIPGFIPFKYFERSFSNG